MAARELQRLQGTNIGTDRSDGWMTCDFTSFSPIFQLQSTLAISKLKGPSETLRDIRTSTYQICRIEENTNRTTKVHK